MNLVKVAALITVLLCYNLISHAQQAELYTQPKKVNSLKLNKPNKVLVKLPKDMNWKQMSVSSSSAKITKGEQRGYFTIIPQQEDITVNIYNGKTLYTTLNYEAYTPFFQVQSANVMALYFNCGNSVFINPSEHDIDPMKLNYTIEGGELIKHKEPGYVTIIPDAARVNITVFEGDTKFGDLEFKVRRVPNPEMHLMSENRPIDLKRGISVNTQTMNIKALADDDFKQFLPKDARYAVNDYTVTLASGSKAIKSIRSSSNKLNVSSLLQEAKAGDRLVVEVKKVTRKNYKDEIEQVKNGLSTIFVVPLY